MNTIYEADVMFFFLFQERNKRLSDLPKAAKIISSEHFFNLQYVHHSFAYRIADRRCDLKLKDCYYS